MEIAPGELFRVEVDMSDKDGTLRIMPSGVGSVPAGRPATRNHI
jgi:hypothetical protein